MAFECLKECISEGCFHCDAETLAELAVKAGLMVYEPYDPAKHNMEFSDHEYEPGDMIYYWGKPSTYMPNDLTEAEYAAMPNDEQTRGSSHCSQAPPCMCCGVPTRSLLPHSSQPVCYGCQTSMWGDTSDD